MIKAVFFDLDDTLVDAMECHRSANRDVLELYGIRYDEILKKSSKNDFLGMRMRDILAYKRNLADVSEAVLPISKLENSWIDIFLDKVKQSAKLMPGSREALKFCKEKNLITAITSSGVKNT